MEINTYDCCECNRRLVVGHIDDGTTPFLLVCPECNGDMRSSFYRPEVQALKPELFWFKPTPAQLPKQVQWELEFLGATELVPYESAYKMAQSHVSKGGVLLAPSKDKIMEWAHVN